MQGIRRLAARSANEGAGVTPNTAAAQRCLWHRTCTCSISLRARGDKHWRTRHHLSYSANRLRGKLVCATGLIISRLEHMRFEPTSLAGAYLVHLDPREDQRG